MDSEPTYEVWIKAYAHGSRIFEPSTVIALYDLLHSSLPTNYDRLVKGISSETIAQKRRASAGGEELPVPLEGDPRPWLVEHLNAVYNIGKRDPFVAIARMGPRSKRWHLDTSVPAEQSLWDEQEAQFALTATLPRGCSDETLLQLCKDACEILLKDDRVWYGYIDPIPIGVVSHTYGFQGTWGNGTWEQVLERRTWLFQLARGTRHAKGVYWGNFFGKEMWERLVADGALHSRFNDVIQEWEDYCPVIVNGACGGGAVLLSEKPVTFAFERLDLLANIDFRPAWVGAALRAALCDARML